MKSKMTQLEFFTALFEQVDSIYYSKKDREHFYTYIPGMNCQLTIESPQVNGIKFSLVFEKLGEQDKSISLLVNDWKEVTPLLDKLVKKYQDDLNNDMVGPEGVEFHDHYLELFKLILSNQPLPDGYSYTIDTSKSMTEPKIILHEKENGRQHTLHIGDALIDLNSNKINSLLGSLVISALIQTDIMNRQGYPHRVLRLVIPGYDLEKYSAFKISLRNPAISENFDDFLRGIENLPEGTGENFKINMRHMLLNIQLEEKTNIQASIKNKI